MPENTPDSEQLAELRFNFLFPSGSSLHGKKPRFCLYEPDTLEPRWSVWDRERRCTVAFGTSPGNAVDAAMGNTVDVAPRVTT